MTFNQVAEEVDVSAMTGKKENLAKQLEKITQQEALELQKSMDAIKQKYAGQKNNISKQIQTIDGTVSQEAIALKNTLDSQQKTATKTPVQPVQPVQPVPQPAVPQPIIKPGIVPISPA